MNKEFQSLIIPILKGFPITIILVVVAMVFVTRTVTYMVPQYQTKGSIKIDNRNINLSDLALFEETGRTKGVTSVDFLTEIEMFKSKRLKELTFKRLNSGLSYFRVGRIKTVELYQNNPFEVPYRIKKESAFDKLYYLQYVSEDEFLWSEDSEVFPLENRIGFNRPMEMEDFTFMIRKNKKFLAEKPSSLSIGDVFAFRINSLQSLVNSVNDNNFFVRSIDEKVQIINLYYQHEIPEKAARFINTMMEVYIEDCKKSHQDEADKAIEFIDDQLEEVKKNLKQAEALLVKFKTQKNIMNIKQETDATLKELMQLEMQKVNYDMQESELRRTYNYLLRGNDLRDFAPNFQALKDPIFRETFLNVQKLELKRKDLLMEYTPGSDIVHNVEMKINSMRSFLNESVKNASESLANRKKEMESTIAAISQSVREYPDKEQRTIVLEREVKLNEELYTSLIEKRMEIAVAKTATTVYHQVVDEARASKSSVSPNKPLLYGVALFFALLVGFTLSFLYHFFTARIKSKDVLAELFAAPIIGSIAKAKKGDSIVDALANLYTNLELLQGKDRKDEKAKTVLISSMNPQDGKTFSALNLAIVYATMGKKVLLIDMDVENSELHNWFGIENKYGLSALLRNEIYPQQAVVKTNKENLDLIPSGDIRNIFSGILFAPETTSFIDSLKQDYQIIIIDAPAVSLEEDVMLMMQQVDYNLMVFRANKTKTKTVKKAQKIFEKYETPNVYSIFNGEKRKIKKSNLNPIKKTKNIWEMVASFF